MPKEKNLAIDIWRLRQLIQNRTLDIRHVLRDFNVADALTKEDTGKYTKQLFATLLKTGRYVP
jgi:hypothetical protein